MLGTMACNPQERETPAAARATDTSEAGDPPPLVPHIKANSVPVDKSKLGQVPGSKPNILLIVSDDTGYGDCSMRSRVARLGALLSRPGAFGTEVA
jgi:hypothetical protein